MGAAVRVVHVPDPTASGEVAALASTGTSWAALADDCGVSKGRVQQWARGEAAPNLEHVRRMPASVRRAIGQQLLGGAQVTPVPRALWDKALLRLLAHVSEMASRVGEAEGDPKARAALLREIHAAREHLARLEAGVLATTEGG